MSKFVFAYHGGGMPEDPADQQAVMQAWEAWFGAMGAAVVDGGNPTGEARTIESDGSVTTGGGANPITGYSLIEAADLDAALAHAKGCPILDSGGTVEVAEALAM